MGSKKHNRIDFNTFYQNLYPQRWQSLKDALLQQAQSVPYHERLLQPYYLDEGSILSALQLPLAQAHQILDMCAAPGGKSLILASRMPEDAQLTCNDRSRNRRFRLHSVLDNHLPSEIHQRVKVTSHDASRWALYEQSVYDAILLDAPCSSERHVLQDASALAQWTPARTKHLAIQQFAMLASALEAVKVGGYVLYSTCSISPLENEDVIAKLEKKRAGRYTEIDCEVPFTESLRYGYIIMPDTAQGRGPLYFCLLRRTA
jgi:16S rRNA C967 or C1407 C5-methylase (RsmB/RsmF family)